MKSISIVVEAEGELNALVDPDLLSRILENLIENANRYTNNGGTIALMASKASNATKISVGNTGTPIPADRRAKHLKSTKAPKTGPRKAKTWASDCTFANSQRPHTAAKLRSIRTKNGRPSSSSRLPGEAPEKPEKKATRNAFID